MAFAEVAFSGTEVLGVSDAIFSESIRLYPNPANEYITLDNSSNIELKGINVYDMIGRLVKQIEVRNNTQTIEISNLPSGVYLFQMYNEKRSTLKRVIKK